MTTQNATPIMLSFPAERSTSRRSVIFKYLQLRVIMTIPMMILAIYPLKESS